MMKKNVFIILLLFVFFKGISQQVSVSMEVIEIKEKNNFAFYSKDSINVPYLLIKYTNNLDSDIYIRKIVDPMKNYMPIAISHWYKPTGDLPSLQIKDTISTYKVFLEFEHPYAYNWEIKDEEIYMREKKEIEETGTSEYFHHPANDYFQAINSAIYIQDLLNKNNLNLKLKYFNFLNKKNIKYDEAVELLIKKRKIVLNKNLEKIKKIEEIDCFKKYFVFLKKDQEYVQRVNLIALKFLGKNFSFEFPQENSKNFLELYGEKLVKRKLFFPDSLNGFNYYKKEKLLKALKKINL
ncbi:hypothetical protein JL193_09515 [Polaribacter batillariae]|uniref:Uncharacterized protein n=1 Tax=Polaribacter batillariae TaxID=2808900 RepID=A0ABX7SQ94_9FLAO|nr:hypothetical protein [Polaribacter batillariae]QTD36397.1 hypothetical protein JL193_09515 [Polaribacter batillariae]